MMIGSVLFPAGFFLAGWTSDPSINWFPSVLGFTLIGTSFLLIFQVSQTTDPYVLVRSTGC
jgi:DHA1 family multidrug resistance protein-like MFS transporter